MSVFRLAQYVLLSVDLLSSYTVKDKFGRFRGTCCLHNKCDWLRFGWTPKTLGKKVCVPVTCLLVAQRVGRIIVLLFHDRGTRRGWVVSSTPRPYFTPGKDPVPIVQEAGWDPGPVWTGGKSRPIGIGSPDRPARSQSLYRLSCPAHTWEKNVSKILIQGLYQNETNHKKNERPSALCGQTERRTVRCEEASSLYSLRELAY